MPIELICDARILSKDGILLFTQRYLSDFYITITPADDADFYRIILNAKSHAGETFSQENLQNELLECEFIAMRYARTATLRQAIEERIIAAAGHAAEDAKQ